MPLARNAIFPFQIIHFLFNRSRLIYLDLASDQVHLCIWCGGAKRRRKKNRRELYVKYGDPVLKLHIHAGQDLYHVFDSFSIVERV